MAHPVIEDKNIRPTLNSNHYHRLFMVVFVLVALCPLLKFPRKVIENKPLVGNDWLQEIYASVRYALGDRVFDVALLGKNNWLSYTAENSLDDYQNTRPFSQQDLADIQRKLDRLNALLRSKGIKLIVVIPPNKNTIYPEYMAPQVPILGKQSRLDQLLNYEKTHGEFKIMDLRPALLQARSEHQLYYAHDAHWNPFGAFVAYREIMSELQIDFPSIQAHTLNDFNVVPGSEPEDLIYADYLDFVIRSDLFSLDPKFPRDVTMQLWMDGSNDPSFYNTISMSNITTTKPDKTLPRLLMFRDSYADILIPFLSDQFSRAVYLWAFPENETYYASEAPDVVIIEYTERYLSYLLTIPG